MAAILDAILIFSKRTRVTNVHPADSERRRAQLYINQWRKQYIYQNSSFTLRHRVGRVTGNEQFLTLRLTSAGL